MKKTLLASAFALIAATASAQTSYTGAYDGKVSFNGEVVDQTCVVETGNGLGKNLQTVTLDKVQQSKLDGATKVAGGKTFSIKLQNCKASSTTQNVRAEFRMSPNVDIANAYTLKNTKQGTAGYATNVNLRLLEKDGTTAIRIGDPAYVAQYHNLNNKTEGEMFYNVEYYATGVATTGKVESEVEYSIVYQ